jgi:2-methylcitrate dehydratase PrpD
VTSGAVSEESIEHEVEHVSEAGHDSRAGESSPGPTITGRVIDRVRSLDALSEEAILGARHCILDTLGVAIGGLHEPVTAAVRESVLEDGSRPQARIWGTAERVSRTQAALANGTAAHALDFDDVSAAMEGHPSAPLLPALLAAAEGAGITGRQLLAAFVMGFEAEAMIGRLMSPSHYARGFHTTATVGAFGAAVASSQVLGLPPGQWSHSLGIAGSQAAGLKSMFGTMAKPLQVGAASENGLRAALLARRGVTAHPDVLGVAQGFRDTQSDAAVLPSGWSEGGLAITEVLFKHHAACYMTHSAIEGVRSMRELGVTPDRVESVLLQVPPGHLKVCNIQNPSTPLEGKFSLRFTAAIALVTGDLTERAFTAESLSDPHVVELMDRVHVEARPGAERSTIVFLTCMDGTHHRAEVNVNQPTRPPDLDRRWEALVSKFHSLVDPVLGSEPASRVVALVDGLASANSVEPLLQSLAGGSESRPSLDAVPT